MNSTIDLVTVPDFRPEPAVLFEARTLFFLASWLERAGKRARSLFRLHLACIGEPPASVRRLAARCEAGISLHLPLPINDGSTTNKMRGFEAPPGGSRLLLVDTDLLVLNDPGGLIDALPSHVVAVSPACRPRVPDEYWEIIYDTLHLPRPPERMRSIRVEQGLLEAPSMYPYYNSGVMLLPRSVDLRPVWEADVAAVRSIFKDRSTDCFASRLPAVLASDQAGLACALHRLKLAGLPVVRLPEAFHFRPAHFAGGAMGFDQVCFFHAIHFLRDLKARDEIEPLMEKYIERWTGEIRSGWQRRGQKRFLFRGWLDARKAAEFLRTLWRRHVEPALQA